MQPTLPPASTDDMDSLSIQSMDWLFKKERIYLLAQFWQQVRINLQLRRIKCSADVKLLNTNASRKIPVIICVHSNN
jgi:hypothetical protein